MLNIMGKFEADLFVMTNATKFESNSTYQMPITERLNVASNVVTLTKTPVANSVSIAGLEQAAESAQGKFVVNTSGATTTITFYSGDVGASVEVHYFYLETVEEANIDNRSSAIGEAILQWPVYGNGDDCTDASIIGYVTMKVYKCRVTAQPGFDSSYKQANTFQFTLAAMDAKRTQDEACYSIAYKKTVSA